MTQNIDEIIKYINTLDVWIVSHGGCGSNYIVDLLNDNGFKVRDGPRKEAVYYGKSCHLAFIPTNITTKILYIYGDIINSMCSQKERNLLDINLNKLKYGHKNSDPNDPYNYLYQYNNFYNSDKVVTLKYPFTNDSITEALTKLNIKLEKDPSVKPRNKIYKKPYAKEIENVYNIYCNSDLK
jgi:hypothetical protein